MTDEHGYIYATTTRGGLQAGAIPRHCVRPNTFSGAETNLKEGGGHMSSAKRRKKLFFFVVHLHVFGSTSTTSRFGERFRDGRYSLVSLLLAVLLFMLPPCPAICKSGGRARYPVSPCPMESTPLNTNVYESCGNWLNSVTETEQTWYILIHWFPKGNKNRHRVVDTTYQLSLQC